MSAPKSKDFFSSFLESADATSKSGDQSSPESGTAERYVLQYLLGRDEPVSVKEMLTEISVPPSLTMLALKRLTDAKLVEYHRIENDDCVRLSELGRHVSS